MNKLTLLLQKSIPERFWLLIGGTFKSWESVDTYENIYKNINKYINQRDGKALHRYLSKLINTKYYGKTYITPPFIELVYLRFLENLVSDLSPEEQIQNELDMCMSMTIFKNYGFVKQEFSKTTIVFKDKKAKYTDGDSIVIYV